MVQNSKFEQHYQTVMKVKSKQKKDRIILQQHKRCIKWTIFDLEICVIEKHCLNIILFFVENT